MEMYTLANGIKIKEMDMENAFGIKLYMKDSGKMISSMEKVRKYGRMVLSMLALILRGRHVGRGCFYVQMDPLMKVNENKIIFMAMVSING